MLETKSVIEIKVLGKRITPDSTQAELKSAVDHNPSLLKSGLIFETKNNTQDGKKSEQSENSNKENNGKHTSRKQ